MVTKVSFLQLFTKAAAVQLPLIFLSPTEGMGFDNFVCVESVKFDPVTVDAGDSWEGCLVLKPESL